MVNKYTDFDSEEQVRFYEVLRKYAKICNWSCSTEDYNLSDRLDCKFRTILPDGAAVLEIDYFSKHKDTDCSVSVIYQSKNMYPRLCKTIIPSGCLEEWQVIQYIKKNLKKYEEKLGV